MKERVLQIANWAHQKKLDLAAGAALTFAAAACSGGAKGENRLIQEVSSIAITPTAIPEVPTEVVPTPTPEAPKFLFGNYDVYVGKIDDKDGGVVVFTSLPDSADGRTGRIAFISLKPKPQCRPETPSNSTAFNFNFVGQGRYTDSSLSVNVLNTKKAKATLVGPEEVHGEISTQEQRIRIQDGTIFICEAGTFAFSAQKAGNGRDDFVKQYMDHFNAASASINGRMGRITNFDSTKTILERSLGFVLPE